VSLICTEVLFGLRIKTLITLNIFGATFGIGGGLIDPIASPGYAPVESSGWWLKALLGPLVRCCH